MATISVAPTWSAKAGSSGAGITRRPEGSWVTSRLSSSGGSMRSRTDTASTIVWCGVSLSITATSPNWRSASTRHTGWSERRANSTASDVDSIDLPAPPLVENTVMTWPSTLGRGSTSSGTGVDGTGIDALRGAWSSDMATRCTAWASAPDSPVRASTSRTPARRATCRSWVESSSTTRMVASSGYSRWTCSLTSRVCSSLQDGPRTATTGTAPVRRAESSSTVLNGVTPSPRSPMIRSRVGTWDSTTATDTRMVGWVTSEVTAKSVTVRSPPLPGTATRRPRRGGRAGCW